MEILNKLFFKFFKFNYFIYNFNCICFYNTCEYAGIIMLKNSWNLKKEMQTQIIIIVGATVVVC